MTEIPPSTVHLRAVLRRPTDALAAASIGTVPILWNNVDLTDLAPPVEPQIVLDEIARTGYEGTQEGRGFPRHQALRSMLEARGLRLAEAYLSIPCSADGPHPGARTVARDRLRTLHDGGGEVLVAALDVTPERSAWSGRASGAGVPQLTRDGWRRLADVIATLAAEALELGHRVAWHSHAGTYVETPDELDRLLDLVPDAVGVCLDTGHYSVGGGDPVAALRRYGARATHVHLKDIDGHVLGRLRAGEIADFQTAIRARLFTELGAGVLDVAGAVAALDERDYAGWLMVEQDSCWGPPSESAAIGRRVLAQELRRAGRAPSWPA